MKYPPGREDFLNPLTQTGILFAHLAVSMRLCAILFQCSPNHILTVKLNFHCLIIIQINHADKSIHTLFCQPTDVRFLAGLLCQSADFFIQFIGTLLFFLFYPYAILQCSQFFRKNLFLFYVRIPQQYTVRIQFIQFNLLHPNGFCLLFQVLNVSTSCRLFRSVSIEISS